MTTDRSTNGNPDFEIVHESEAFVEFDSDDILSINTTPPEHRASLRRDRTLRPLPDKGASAGESRIAGSTNNLQLERIGTYELQRVIEQTPTYTVYAARGLSGGHPVALKAMDPLNMADARISSEEWLATFEREGEMAARLSFPYIPRLLDAAREGDLYFLVYTRTPGICLPELLHDEEALDPERTARLLTTLAESLAHMHQHGVLFCSVQPQSIVVTDDGQGHLANLSRLAPVGGPFHPLMAANPFALAPEFIESRIYTEASEQFGLGAVAYEVLTGTRPFRGLEDHAILAAVMEKSPRPPQDLDSEIDAELSEITMKLLAKQPEHRFESAAEVAEVVRDRGARAGWSMPPRV